MEWFFSDDIVIVYGRIERVSDSRAVLNDGYVHKWRDGAIVEDHNIHVCDGAELIKKEALLNGRVVENVPRQRVVKVDCRTSPLTQLTVFGIGVRCETVIHGSVAHVSSCKGILCKGDIMVCRGCDAVRSNFRRKSVKTQEEWDWEAEWEYEEEGSL